MKFWASAFTFLPATLLLADIVAGRHIPGSRFDDAYYPVSAVLAALFASQFGLIAAYAAMGTKRWFARLPIALGAVGIVYATLTLAVSPYDLPQHLVPLLIGYLSTIYGCLAIARLRGVAVTLRPHNRSTPPASADKPFRFTVTHMLLVVTYMALIIGFAGFLKPSVRSGSLGFLLISEGVPVLFLATVTIAALWAALSRAHPLLPLAVLLVPATPTGAWYPAVYPRGPMEAVWWFMAAHGLHALLSVALLLPFRRLGYRIALRKDDRGSPEPIPSETVPPVKLRWMLVPIALLALGVADWQYAYLRNVRAEQALVAAGAELTLAYIDRDRGRTVYLSFQSADDSTLRHVRGFFSLRGLDLRGSRITDAGLEHVAALSKLEQLGLADTEISDQGLHHLARLTSLNVLDLDGTQIEGPGLTHLSPRASLRLILDNTRVSDAGLAYLQHLTGLSAVSLQNTSITDAGLEHLKPLTSLRLLDLRGTAVTDAGVKDLQQSLPALDVQR